MNLEKDSEIGAMAVLQIITAEINVQYRVALMKSLNGKTAIVTGSTSGIGLGIARRLLSRGNC